MQHITVFHQPNCQPCRLTMKMLDKLGATYDSRSLDDGNPEAERVLNNARALGMTSAPIVEVRDESGTLVRTLSGYRPAELREIAGAAR
nr:MAG TPA: NrdH [Caudoviricetes sp.]